MSSVKDKKLSMSSALLDTLELNYITLAFVDNSYEDAYFDYRMDINIKVTQYVLIFIGVARTLIFMNMLFCFLFLKNSIEVKDLVITFLRALIIFVIHKYNGKPLWYKSVYDRFNLFSFKIVYIK